MEGDSEIIDKELVVPFELEPGVVISTDGTGEELPYMRVTVECLDPQPGKTYRVIVNYRAADPAADPPVTDDYFAGELECLAADISWIRILRVSDGAETVLHELQVSYIAGETEYLDACRTEEGLFFSANPSQVAWDCVPDNDGRRAGVSNASSDSAEIEFDNFLFLRGFDNNGDRCFLCDCECEGHCLPKELTLTFDGTGACACITGTTITLNYVPGPIIKWEGSGLVPALDDCPYEDTGEFLLLCDNDPYQFELQNTNAWPASMSQGWTWNGTVHIAFPNSAVCDPLELTYPENAEDVFSFTMSPPCPYGVCDCTYTITITE